MVPYVSLPPPSRQLSTQPRTSAPPPPSHQNHESSTLEEMEVEDTPSMSPPPNMKLEPKSPHGHKRLVPYVSVPSPPRQNHESATLDEMAVEDTPSMSPPPNMKLEPKSPHGHKRLVPYVSVPSRQMSVWPANKRPANDDLTQGSPKLSTQRRKLGSGPPVKDEVPHATPKTRRTALISAKVRDHAFFNQVALFIQPDSSQRHPPQVPTPATTSKRPKKEVHLLEFLNIPSLTIFFLFFFFWTGAQSLLPPSFNHRRLPQIPQTPHHQAIPHPSRSPTQAPPTRIRRVRPTVPPIPPTKHQPLQPHPPTHGMAPNRDEPPHAQHPRPPWHRLRFTARDPRKPAVDGVVPVFGIAHGYVVLLG